MTVKCSQILLKYPVYELVGEEQRFHLYLSTLAEQLRVNKLSHIVLAEDLANELSLVLQVIRYYDVVFLRGQVPFAVKQIVLGKTASPWQNSLSWPSPKPQATKLFLADLFSDLQQFMAKTPVWACILIGGRSSRMGQPKHLIQDSDGTTWLEKAVATVRPYVTGIVLSGRGEVSRNLSDLPRLPDIPSVAGPLNGILSAGRWQPHLSWLLMACDMPCISGEAIGWLLQDRTFGCWGKVPQIPGRKYPEPLFAWYDFRSVGLFEKQLLTGNLRIGEIAAHEKISTPAVPQRLLLDWQNVNTPEQLSLLAQKSYPD